MREEELRKALKGSLSGVTFDPARQRAVMADMRETRPVRRRMSLAVALVAALVLLGGTAVAAGLGLFGRLAQVRENPETDLDRLEELAETYEISETVTIDHQDITLTLHQAYCDGVRLFLSYELSHSGKMGDGCYLADGTPLNNIESDWLLQEDGSEIGYQVHELPEDMEFGDTVDIELTVSGVHVPFTIPMSGTVMTVAGQADFGTYSAEATLQLTGVAMRGSVYLENPEGWSESWKTNGQRSSDEDTDDMIVSYVLLSDGEQLRNRDGGFGIGPDGRLEILVQFDAPTGSELVLVPVYLNGGECPEESFPISIVGE